MKTHDLEIDGVGDFVFKHRTLRLSTMILAEYEKIVSGVENPSRTLHGIATWLSVLKVLIDEAPKDFDIEELDPLDSKSYTRLDAVYTALVGAEKQFRQKHGEDSKTERKEAGGEDKPMVQKDVSATT